VLTIGLALGLAILLFAVLPTAGAHLLIRFVPGSLAQNLIEGAFRIAVFVAYIVVIARLADIKRVFEYHGAEHKVINAYEAGEELTVSNVQRYSALHPRCGRILSRVLLLPLVAGISYELVKLSAKHYSKPLCRIMIAPGLWLQKLTTRPPDDGQVEVAIRALCPVLKEGEKLA